MFKAKPALIISGIVSFPEPKTIALGGVATGNMNAQLAANTTGIVRATGAMPKATATAPTTGKNVEVVATLEVISVRKIIKVATAKINTIGGTFSNTVNPCPILTPMIQSKRPKTSLHQIRPTSPRVIYLLAPR